MVTVWRLTISEVFLALHEQRVDLDAVQFRRDTNTAVIDVNGVCEFIGKLHAGLYGLFVVRPGL